MKAVVLVDPASSGEPFKTSARDLGFKVIGVFTQSAESVSTLYHVDPKTLFKGCDLVIVSDEKEEILRQLGSCGYSIKAVIAATEAGVEMADQIAHALHLLGNPIEHSEARRDKGKMRALLKESGLSCPDFRVCTSKEEVMHFANTHRYPLMVKTPKGVMTSDVYQCENLEELFRAFDNIYGKENIYGAPANCVVVEEYLLGSEYCVNTFSDGEKVHVTDVWLYEKIHTPTYKNVYYNSILMPLSDPDIAPLLSYATHVAEVFGIQRGPAHIEIKDDPARGPTLLEIGARLAGIRLPQFMRKYSNIDVYKASLEVFSKGRTTIAHPVLFTKHLAIALFPMMQGGRVEKIFGIEEIQKLSSYDSHILSIKKGEEILPTTHGSSIPLLVYLAHESRAQLLQDMDAAHKLFVIECTPEGKSERYFYKFG